MAKGGCGESEETWEAGNEFIVDAPVDKVWGIVGDFANIGRWARSMLESSRVAEGVAREPGCIRVCSVKPFGSMEGPAFELHEKLLELDDSRRIVTYELLAPTVPICEGIVATLQLFPSDDSPDCTSTRLVWRSHRPASPHVDRQSYVDNAETFYRTLVLVDLAKALAEEQQ